MKSQRLAGLSTQTTPIASLSAMSNGGHVISIEYCVP